jgi:hypothetical protein
VILRIVEPSIDLSTVHIAGRHAAVHNHFVHDFIQAWSGYVAAMPLAFVTPAFAIHRGSAK